MKPRQRKTALFISLRYLFSKKKHNIINVISLVSMLGIMVCSAALIVVLSVFNGMEEMISGWFNAFNPDFEITLVEGKAFEVDSFPKAEIMQLPEVAAVSEVVSDLVLTSYQDRQEILRLKGVDAQYTERNHYDRMLIDGTFDLQRGGQACAVLGTGAAGRLLIHLNSYERLKIYYPKRTKKNLADPTSAFNTEYLYPTGVFCTNTSYDQDYVFCPIEFARTLMMYEGEVTSIEVQLKAQTDANAVQKKIQSLLGERYKVQNKFQQEASLFKTMQSEKLIIYVILAFILLVAAFNIIGSLGMLILEKQDDVQVLRCMGASTSLIQRIFLYEGMATSLLGGLGGLVLGLVICFLQQTFHIVKLGSGGEYLISYYPVQMHGTDFILVLATTLVISLLTSILPASRLRKSFANHHL